MADAVILSRRGCELGEGPAFDQDTQTLWWFDILGRQLLEMKWPDGETIVHPLPFMASALACVDDRRQLLLSEYGLYVRDRESGALELHAPIEQDSHATRSNDARVHPSGALWAGTMGKQAQKGAGAIYWFRKGEVRKLYVNFTIPNSICFSPDGATAYFTDSADNRLMRVACDPATGIPAGEPQVLYDNRRSGGGLDGSVCDAEGNIWNARWGAGSVDVYTPQGERIASHAVPARQTSCPVFCGPAAEAVAVTTAWEGMDDRQRAADPHAGKLFRLTVTARGRFDPRVVI
jgi:sugar lactone lactonase YvrE